MRLATGFCAFLTAACIADGSPDVDDVDVDGSKADDPRPECVPSETEPCPPDPFVDARDVTKAHVTFPEGTVAPTSYQYPRGNGFNLGGTEFWQKWSGGHSPTYSFAAGTDAGRLCMQASAIRFEEIMKDPPAELVRLRDESSWGGSFFNWNDDYSQSEWGDASGPRLWAWRTSLIKWISQTKQDGSCLLPTRELVIAAATSCLTRGEEIQGCSARL